MKTFQAKMRINKFVQFGRQTHSKGEIVTIEAQKDGHFLIIGPLKGMQTGTNPSEFEKCQ